VRDTIAEVVAAFANADGGTLIVGAEDDGRRPGMATPRKQSSSSSRCPSADSALRFASPHSACASTRRAAHLQVRPHPEAVMVVGMASRSASAIRSSESHRRRSTSARPSTGALATSGRRDPRRASMISTPSSWRSFSPLGAGGRSVPEILTAYGSSSHVSEASPSHAALLLFGRSPLARWHPRAGARLFRVRGTSAPRARAECRAARRIERLWSARSRHSRNSSRQIRRSEVLHNLFFREMPEYPEFACRRDRQRVRTPRLRGSGREIEVWLFDDRMEISSPGVLVPPVTLSDLRSRTRVHASRNPLIARVLVDSGSCARRVRAFAHSRGNGAVVPQATRV